MEGYKKLLKDFIEALPEENKNMKLFKYIEEKEEKNKWSKNIKSPN